MRVLSTAEVSQHTAKSEQATNSFNSYKHYCVMNSNGVISFPLLTRLLTNAISEKAATTQPNVCVRRKGMQVIEVN
eukprot:2978325-Amphidinium_carterae.1